MSDDDIIPSYIERVKQMKFLPEGDKSLLLDFLPKGYGHAQAVLSKLSIFREFDSIEHFDGYGYHDFSGVSLYYAGNNFRTNAALFFDEDRKIVFNSRHYTSHLNGFVQSIDAALGFIAELSINNASEIGENYLSIEKWFTSYGHFQDEAYSLGDFIERFPFDVPHTVLLDYPYLEGEGSRIADNYRSIDWLIFNGKSINAYVYGQRVLKLRNLKLIVNGFDSTPFHSFPPAVRERIMSQVARNKILITRSNSLLRDIANKIEVEAAFAAAGYVIVNPEILTFREFLMTIKDADQVVMYFGSAMTNMVYFKPGAKVYILKADSYLEENIRLWRKVIENYNLDIKEIEAVYNKIPLEDLSSILM
ncbi:glycosyltransferase 61 family protein [Zavarzinia sp.]|uniref:glycosyltransferase 61 family protein n=1 Tax=Zavarzinia sp. TaxID=2027920 RepID=UPI003BB70512